MEKFSWPRMHKDEERIEREAYDCVETVILNHYEIEDIADLTKEQWDEIHEWQEEYVGEYSPMNIGFSDVYNYWEMQNE